MLIEKLIEIPAQAETNDSTTDKSPDTGENNMITFVMLLGFASMAMSVSRKKSA